MATNRKKVPNKVRFEVFKRDKFTCQYCGRSAPDVVLNIEHITPVSKGGTNEITNLVTACFECNNGKSDIELSDDAAVRIQKQQLDMLQDRREQLEMMRDWQVELTKSMPTEASIVADVIRTMIPEIDIDQSRMRNLAQIAKRFGVAEACESARIAFSQYRTNNEEEIDFAFRKIGGICFMREKQREDE